MKRYIVLFLLVCFLACSGEKTLREELCGEKDTIQVIQSVRNVFHIEVKSLVRGRGFGINIPDSNFFDTTYFIKYPNDSIFRKATEEDRQKIKKFVL